MTVLIIDYSLPTDEWSHSFLAANTWYEDFCCHQCQIQNIKKDCAGYMSDQTHFHLWLKSCAFVILSIVLPFNLSAVNLYLEPHRILKISKSDLNMTNFIARPHTFPNIHSEPLKCRCWITIFNWKKTSNTLNDSTISPYRELWST